MKYSDPYEEYLKNVCICDRVCEIFYLRYLKDICVKPGSTIYVTSRGAWKLGGLEHAGDDIANDVDIKYCINISIANRKSENINLLSESNLMMRKYKRKLHEYKKVVSVKLNDEDDEVEATSWTTKMPKAAQPNLNYIGGYFFVII